MVSGLLKRSGGYFLGMASSRILTTIVFIIFARHFTPDIFGDLVLYITLLAIVTYIADVGLVQWYQKAAESKDRKKLFHTIISARIHTLLISMGVVALFLYFVPTFSLALRIGLILNLGGEAMLNIVDGYYLEKKQPYKVSLKYGIRGLLLILIYFVYSQFEFTLNQAIFWFVVTTYIAGFWVFPWQVMKGFAMKSFEHTVKTVKTSFPYALLTMTSLAYARGDQLVVRYTLNSTALGLYGGAYRYLESISLLPTALSHNLFPLSARKKGVTLNQLFKIMGVTIVVGAVVSGVTFLLSDFLIIDILGKDYADAVPLLQIFSAVLMLFFVNAPLAAVVQSSSYVKKFLPYGIANTVANIALNIALVPVYGVQMAAWIMLFTEITGLFINIAFVLKVYDK